LGFGEAAWAIPPLRPRDNKAENSANRLFMSKSSLNH
jgi:hypothetical protein